jgi:hypothetical protein
MHFGMLRDKTGIVNFQELEYNWNNETFVVSEISPPENTIPFPLLPVEKNGQSR